MAEIVDGDQYATLGEAIAALTGAEDETIKLLVDYTAADAENLWFTKSATLDLGEFTLTVPAAIASEEGKFGVAADAELTFKNGEIVMLGNGGRGVNIKGGVLNIYCTITRESTATSSSIVDIYDGGTVNVYDGAVLNSYGHVFNFKKASPNGQFLNVYGGTINSLGSDEGYSVIYLCYAGINANLNIAGGTFNIGDSSLCKDHACNPVITGLLTDTCEAKFDKPQGKSGQHYLVADGYEFVQGDDEYYTIAKIPSFDVTFTVDDVEIPDSATNVLRDTTLTADMIPDVSDLEGAWDVDPLGAIITETTNFNFTTVKYVTITLTQELPEGVTALVVSQKVDDVWIEVDDNQIVVGNEWKVEATVADGYTVDNPIKSGTAELGVNITVTKADVEGKITPPAADVAELNGVKYASLGAAIAALTGTGDETIKLLANYTAAADEDLTFTKSATLDLGEFELTLPKALLDGKKFKVADGAEVSFENGTITMGDSAYGLQVHGTATVVDGCTMTKPISRASGPIFDIYGLGEASTNGGTVIVNGGTLTSNGDVFRHKKLAAKAAVIINGGTITATPDGDYDGHQGIFYAAYTSDDDVVTITGGKFIGKFDNASEKWGNGKIKFGAEAAAALFDGTAKLRMANYLADGFELVESTTETGFWQIAKIPSFDVTFTQNNEPIAGSTTNVLRDTVLTADMIPAVEGGTWDVDPLNAVITCNTNFNYTVAVGPEWPSDWPTDVPATMKEAFQTWATTYGVTSFEGVENAFLMNDDPKAGTATALKIESISVEGTTATIVVSAGEKDLVEDINGVLFVSATDDLAGEWKTTQVEQPKSYTEDGKAIFEVAGAQFMKAKVGFKVETPVDKE